MPARNTKAAYSSDHPRDWRPRRTRRLDQDRVRKKSGKGRKVREREQPVGQGRPMPPAVPGLDQRACGREQEVGEAYGEQEQPEDAQDGVLIPGRLPGKRRRDGQHQQTETEQAKMDQGLHARFERA